MYQNTKRIIVKKGYKSFKEDCSYYDILLQQNINEYFHLFKFMVYKNDLILYALLLRNKSIYNFYFEMLIPKSETSIIELLDSIDYDNFLIAKQLIKSKLKSYGK